jgi:hypothetical protein
MIIESERRTFRKLRTLEIYGLRSNLEDKEDYLSKWGEIYGALFRVFPNVIHFGVGTWYRTTFTRTEQFVLHITRDECENNTFSTVISKYQSPLIGLAHLFNEQRRINSLNAFSQLRFDILIPIVSKTLDSFCSPS